MLPPDSRDYDTNITGAPQSSTIKPNRSLLIIIAIVSFLLLTTLMVLSGNHSAATVDENKLLVMQHAKVEVMSIDVESGYIKPRVVYGQVEAIQQSDIGFELSGILAELKVVEGAYVKKGDVLAKLDTARLRARENELNSALKSAKANANLAKISAQRVAQLVDKNLESEQLLDEANAQVDASNAIASEAQARLDSLKVEFTKSLLHAPYDGQVVRQFIDMGTIVSPGIAVFSLLASHELEVRFGLPEQTAFGLKPSQTHMLSIRGNEFKASVKSVASQRNIATRTIDSVFTIDSSLLNTEQKSQMITGDLVSFTVDIPIKLKGAWVPISALASGVRGLWTLYIVDKNQTIQTRLVSIAYADEKKAFVNGAINQGEQVVISGIHRLVPQQHVDNVVEVDSEGVYARSSLTN